MKISKAVAQAEVLNTVCLNDIHALEENMIKAKEAIVQLEKLTASGATANPM